MNLKISLFVMSLVAILSINAVISISQDNEDDEKATNLQVLPKDIGSDDLDHIMKAFANSLGVKCSYCHAPKSNGEKGLDFASDDNPKKDIARFMIKMTNEINANYFKDHRRDSLLLQVGCMTCHNGKAHPQMREIK